MQKVQKDQADDASSLCKLAARNVEISHIMGSQVIDFGKQAVQIQKYELELEQ